MGNENDEPQMSQSKPII